MILALDVGNTQMYGGVFEGDRMRASFRRNSMQGSSSDEIGIFLRSVLRENNIDPASIKHIALCSVVPDVVYSLRGACRKYFDKDAFLLQAGVKTGLKIKYRNPSDVGADRISNAIAGAHLYPNKNLIIVDLGTATTFDVVSADREYLGGAIIAGMKLCMQSLETKTAKLPSVEIISPSEALGRSTVESIQAGLYYGHVGQIRELCDRLTKECFGKNRPMIVGTGGFASLFEREKIFDVILPDLVLKGLLISLQMNTEHEGRAV
ncbi:MAG TPA: type III pantothenate kinase [Pseudobdellovibrionaceae bacterium]|nr:type III pantothenate kinase [Pseudobdellovibrionaceae bacterium]